MPHILAPKTVHAHEEIKGRIEVLKSQAAEARREVANCLSEADKQRTAAEAIESLLASYAGLIEDAGM